MSFQKIISWMQNRIWEQNKNNLIIICGETGSGKSYRALRIAYLLTHRKEILSYDMPRPTEAPCIWVVFKTKEFFSLLSSGKLRKGDVIIWEEGGVECNNRNWYTLSNKLVNFAFQTMRHMNFTLIMNLPSVEYLDSGLRGLFHLYIETKFVDFKKNMVNCKVKRIQHNPEIPKTYRKYFRMRGADGHKFIASNIWIKGPPAEMIEQYEPIKAAYTKQLYTESEKEIEDTEVRSKKDWQASKDYTEQINDAKPKRHSFQRSETDTRVSWEKIKQAYGVSVAGAKIIAVGIS
jgi:energy-coupling factor transporter ATP-binding protein EcfA2